MWSLNVTTGADPGFFLGGGALVSCSTSTPINHIVFFWQNTSCIRKPQVISGGRGVLTPCTLPLDPPLYKLALWPTLIQKFMNFWSFFTRPGDKHNEELRNCTSTSQAGPSSQFCCGSHDFVTFVTAPHQDSQSHRNVYCCWIVIWFSCEK